MLLEEEQPKPRFKKWVPKDPSKPKLRDKYPYKLIHPRIQNLKNYRKLLPFGQTGVGKAAVPIQHIAGKSTVWLRKSFIPELVDKVKYLLYTVRILHEYAYKKAIELNKYKRIVARKGYLTKREAREYVHDYYKTKMVTVFKKRGYYNSADDYLIMETYRKKVQMSAFQVRMMIILSRYNWFELETDCDKWELSKATVKNCLNTFVAIGYVDYSMKQNKYKVYTLTDAGKKFINGYGVYYVKQKKLLTKPTIKKKNPEVWEYVQKKVDGIKQ